MDYILILASYSFCNPYEGEPVSASIASSFV